MILSQYERVRRQNYPRDWIIIGADSDDEQTPLIVPLARIVTPPPTAQAIAWNNFTANLKETFACCTGRQRNRCC